MLINHLFPDWTSSSYRGGGFQCAAYWKVSLVSTQADGWRDGTWKLKNVLEHFFLLDLAVSCSDMTGHIRKHRSFRPEMNFWLWRKVIACDQRLWDAETLSTGVPTLHLLGYSSLLCPMHYSCVPYIEAMSHTFQSDNGWGMLSLQLRNKGRNEPLHNLNTNTPLGLTP